MRVTGNGRLVELEEAEVRAFEEDDAWIRIAEPDPTRGVYAVYAWCLKGEPVFPSLPREREQR